MNPLRSIITRLLPTAWTSGVLEAYIDLLTRLVSLNPQNFGDVNTKDKGTLFWTKRGGDLVFHITFLKGGVVADLDLAAHRADSAEADGLTGRLVRSNAGGVAHTPRPCSMHYTHHAPDLIIRRTPA
jgi:hypothetical protein